MLKITRKQKEQKNENVNVELVSNLTPLLADKIRMILKKVEEGKANPANALEPLIEKIEREEKQITFDEFLNSITIEDFRDLGREVCEIVKDDEALLLFFGVYFGLKKLDGEELSNLKNIKKN